jgi:hypothetical protein
VKERKKKESEGKEVGKVKERKRSKSEGKEEEIWKSGEDIERKGEGIECKVEIHDNE